MIETLQSLRLLQKTDNRITALKAEISAVPGRLEEIASRRQAARAEAKAVEDKLGELEHQRREKEGDLQLANERLTKYKTQLYQIKTNKEYTAMLHEIEAAEKKIGDLEEQILIAMEEADAEKSKLREVKEATAGVESACEAEEKELKARVVEAERELAAAESTRGETASATDAAALRRYEQIRSHMRGIAVSEVRKGICQGCQMEIMPQLYNELFKRDSLHVCPSCQRILFVDPEAAEGAD